jgi:hypothetical protein
MAGGGVTVSTTEAVLVLSATEVAVTVTMKFPATAFGAM